MFHNTLPYVLFPAVFNIHSSVTVRNVLLHTCITYKLIAVVHGYTCLNEAVCEMASDTLCINSLYLCDVMNKKNKIKLNLLPTITHRLRNENIMG